MKRIDAFGATEDNLFTEGAPESGIPATDVSATWLNQVQEELLSVIEVGGGAEPDGESVTQVLEAIQAMIAAAVPSVTIPTGDTTWAYAATKSGYLPLTGQTLGEGGSGATYSSDSYAALYAYLWDNLSNTYAPVAGGRGANAAADFAAGKLLTMPDTRGRALIGAGQGSGLTNRVLGSSGGEEAHTQLESELVPHIHPQSGQQDNQTESAGGLDGLRRGGSTYNTGSTGGGQAFNVMSPWHAVNWFIKI